MLSYSYLPVWLLLLLAASGAVTSAENVSGTVGKSVYLTVKLDLPVMWQVTWRVNTSIIIVTVSTGGSPIYTDAYRDRCHLYDNTTLRLDNLTHADTGEYTLTVANLNTGASLTGSVYLTAYNYVSGPNPPLSPGAIAGIVIGSLAGVALIATAVFFIVKSTKKKSNKDSSRNPEMNLTGVADKNKEDEEYVKYADLRFKNTNPANNAASQQVPETEYSTVKR